MRFPSPVRWPGPVRRALVRHLAVAAVLAVAMSTLVTIGVWRFAEGRARIGAEHTARQVAATVLSDLSHHDYQRPGGYDRRTLLGELAPYLASGMVDRVKVFTVRDRVATIRFSDEPRNEGVTARLGAALAGRLDRGQVVVQQVPADTEHRYETTLAGSRMEVFFGFRDAGGNDAILEIYVPVDVGGDLRHAILALLPVVLAGLVVLTLAMTPVSVAMARRVERDRAEQRAVRRFGLAAAELARRDIARRLHDEVIPDLAGAGLLLERSGPHPELVDRARAVLAADLRALRGLLAELVPADQPPGDLAARLTEVAAALAGDGSDRPQVRVDVAGAAHVEAPTAVLIQHVAGELLRNAVRHGCPRTVTVSVRGRRESVELTVTDDGAGFDPAAPRPPGHIGLTLVERVVADNGGTVRVVSEPGRGTTVQATLPRP